MKAVLVIDMPNNCEECKITYFQGHGESSICYSGDWSKRPSWCPLRPLPQKKVGDDLYERYGSWTPSDERKVSYRLGYNDCIDEITGETE